MNDSGFANSQVIGYRYDKNGNRLKTLLPNQSAINYHYYGSGHLSAIKYNDQLITEFSRDKLHREISRTQGNLTSQFNRDPVGRLTQQLATLESASKSAATSGEIIRRNYQYDRVGNLTESEDLRTGKTPYRYDKLGQIQLAGQERFAFDPAHNLIEKETQRIENNQLTEYQGNHYRYDEFGNLSERRLANGETQTYRYNVKDQLIKAIIQKPNQVKEEWQYQYDVLGRRTSKVQLENGKILADSQVEFIWDGSHLVQEIDHKNNRTFSYIYSHSTSYEPLAQLEFAKDNETPTAYYYHNDQIGIPRELTDEQGKVCWTGNYSGWGKLNNEYAFVENIHQPFRLQNQYCDSETGLHYNFFRYYEPNIGRFTQLDPIGLQGGMNLYRFEGTVQNSVDPLGLFAIAPAAPWIWKGLAYVGTALTGILVGIGIMDATEENDKAQSTAQSKSESTSKCDKSPCPPCRPYPVGTIGYIGPRTVQIGVDGARNNGGQGVPHFKLFSVNQNPNDCSCRWEHTKKIMREYGHHTYDIPPGAINLNGKGDPPSYP